MGREPQSRGHRQRLATLVVLLLVSGACSSNVEPASPSSVSRGTDGTPIVFLPGIKGSAIADAENDVAFLTPMEVLNLETRRLALVPKFEGDKQQVDNFTAVGILRELYIVPGLVGETIYGPWLDALKSLQRPVYLFPYDWRRDNLETLEALAALVSTVAERHGKKVEVIGHSMGGMLAMALLARDASHLERVTMAGSPLQGGIGFLPDLQAGVAVGMNSALLAPEVMATFPSVYGFFPSTPGTDVDMPELDFFDPAAWAAARIGPYAEGRTPNEAFSAFFATAIAHGKEFRRLVELEPETTVPITVVASDGHPTLTTARHTGTAWDFESTPRTAGDGRVTFERAKPRRLGFKLVPSKAEHAGLLNDPAVISALLTP